MKTDIKVWSMNCENPREITIPTDGLTTARRAQIKLMNGGTFIMKAPCRRCIACRLKQAKELTFRLKEEFKTCYSVYLVTLTYDDEHLPMKKHGRQWVKTFRKTDHQKFLKLLRWNISQEDEKAYDRHIDIGGLKISKTYKKNDWPKVKVFLVSEYGPMTSRPHYHALLFNIPEKFANPIRLQSMWKCGSVDVRENLTEDAISYVTSYLNNINTSKRQWEKETGRKAPYMITSKNIGSGFLKTRNHLIKNNMQTLKKEVGNGLGFYHTIDEPIPSYFMKKLQFPWIKRFVHVKRTAKKLAREKEELIRSMIQQGIKDPEKQMEEHQRRRLQEYANKKLERKNKL